MNRKHKYRGFTGHSTTTPGDDAGTFLDREKVGQNRAGKGGEKALFVGRQPEDGERSPDVAIPGQVAPIWAIATCLDQVQI